MPYHLVVLCRRIAFTLLGDDMQHFRPAVVLNLTQNTHQANHIVPVRRTEIADIQTCKYIARLTGEHRLENIIAPQNSPPSLLVHQMQFSAQLVQFPSPAVIPRAGRQVHQILRDTAFERVNGHMIIVEHDQQIILVHRGVIESLERQSSRHRPIADYRNYIFP